MSSRIAIIPGPPAVSDAVCSVLEEALISDGRQPQAKAGDDGGPRQTCRFTIVIPALNEEQALAGTLTDVLQAREQIMAETPVTAVQVVLVNDGSTDRTQEIAEGFEDVTTVRFERNRGYGAAIKAGFKIDDSELVGFMDADGTLEARSWIDLLNAMFARRADIVLGARLNPHSRMPRIRRFGNWCFARLLGYISGQPLTDCASGMRVLKRSILKYIMPLPDGLHFTPAMSCNALLDRRVRLVEVPVPYAERVGRSKLSVVRDGFRFLTIILLTGCFYNPIKCAATGMVCSWLAAGLAWLAGWEPAGLIRTTVLVNVMALAAALICHQAVKALIVSDRSRNTLERWLQSCTQPRRVAYTGLGALACSAILSLCLLLDSARALEVWGGAALWSCCIGVGLVLLGISLRMLQLIRFKFEALIVDPYRRPGS